MEHAELIRMIKNGVSPTKAARWADVGAGRGAFTKTLAELLGAENTIYAVDKDAAALNHIPEIYAGTQIVKIIANFTTDMLPLTGLNGILMANALHYVRDKQTLLHQLSNMLAPDGQIIIVEYETDKSNAWVPYPVTYNALKKIMTSSGFTGIGKIGEAESVYHSGGLYALQAFQL
jgi:ubiquinone/menaquinone biosynthesis C-methylase UbiE